MKQSLSKIFKVDNEILDEYISHWSEYSIPKKTIFTELGKTEPYLYFVKKGIQKSYYLEDGKEHIMFFSYNPFFTGAMDSFLTRTPAKFYLETITDSQLLRLSYTKHEQLTQKYRPLETLFRKVTENILTGMIERNHELMAFNAETRFKRFMGRSSHLLNKIPQKDIASYLRIDATNFSKLINTREI